MANEPERWSVKLQSVKGGALAWIDYETKRGRPVTRDRFLEEFRGAPFDDEYGQDLLDELVERGKERGEQLAVVDQAGRLQITEHAWQWIDASDFWRETFRQIASEP